MKIHICNFSVHCTAYITLHTGKLKVLAANYTLYTARSNDDSDMLVDPKMWHFPTGCEGGGTLYCCTANSTAPGDFELYYTVLHCTALQGTALHCTAGHCTAQYCTKLYCTALHCTT